MPPFDRMTLVDEIYGHRVESVADIAERIAPFLRDK
jgi:hypothetical protein